MVAINRSVNKYITRCKIKLFNYIGYLLLDWLMINK